MNYLRTSGLRVRALCVGFAGLLASGAVAEITPSFDVFGNLEGATYGGTGIPTYPTAITTIGPATTGGDTITLGLTAHQRYSNPALKNDGRGTYTATPGWNNGLAGPGHTAGPTWNFGFYVNLVPGQFTPSTYTLVLRCMNNGNSDYADQWEFPLLPGTHQDSWNLSMSFINTINFDPMAVGEYGIELDVLAANGDPLGKSAIVVKVENPNAVPDATSTAVLFGIGLLGLIAFRRGLFREPELARRRISSNSEIRAKH